MKRFDRWCAKAKRRAARVKRRKEKKKAAIVARVTARLLGDDVYITREYEQITFKDIPIGVGGITRSTSTFWRNQGNNPGAGAAVAKAWEEAISKHQDGLLFDNALFDLLKKP